MRMREILVEEAEPDFRGADSDQLALAIHELTGAPMLRIGDGAKSVWFVNQLSDDAFVYIDGVRSMVELVNELGVSTEAKFELVSKSDIADRFRHDGARPDPSRPTFWKQVQSRRKHRPLEKLAHAHAWDLIAAWGLGRNYA